MTDGTWTYTWEHGRELASMTDGTTTWNYTYDANGLRTKRAGNTHTYEYVYDGNGKLVFMQYHHYKMYFTYDPLTGAPHSVYYDDGYYEQYTMYYITNARGDVLGLALEDGTVVVSYDYDAWGNLVHYEDNTPWSTGDINPLLYRGYVYDWETGLYYLQSRYYDPEIGRFINADGFTSTGQGLSGNNMFAYCGNNPVIRADTGGRFWHIVAGATVGAVFGIATKMITNAMAGEKLTTGLLTAGLAGAVSGGLAASGIGLVGQVVGNAAISMANNAADQVISLANGTTSEFDVGSMLVDGAIGAVAGFAGGPGAGNKGLTRMGLTNAKRAMNALTHKGWNAAMDVLSKGVAYFAKNAKYIAKPLAVALTKSTMSVLVNQTIKTLTFKERRLG